MEKCVFTRNRDFKNYIHKLLTNGERLTPRKQRFSSLLVSTAVCILCDHLVAVCETNECEPVLTESIFLGIHCIFWSESYSFQGEAYQWHHWVYSTLGSFWTLISKQSEEWMQWMIDFRFKGIWVSKGWSENNENNFNENKC